MVHLSDKETSLKIRALDLQDAKELDLAIFKDVNVYIIALPLIDEMDKKGNINDLNVIIGKLVKGLNPNSVFIVIGDAPDLVDVHCAINLSLRYHHWIAIKKVNAESNNKTGMHLPNKHLGALVYTNYNASLKHTKTRIQYSYCPACNLTSKDYGGKKHTYHHYGTLLSDVWRDIEIDPKGDLSVIINRFSDLFGIVSYKEVLFVDCRKLLRNYNVHLSSINNHNKAILPSNKINSIINGDCIDELKKIPDDCIDFIFVDPPYNLKKKYNGYADDLEIQNYFSWCDNWIDELARVLRLGGTLALLNIPLLSIRHFMHMQKILNFQNWIAWDGLSFPVRLIMPSHYSILCFSKGTPRPLPGLSLSNKYPNELVPEKEFNALRPMKDNYCFREKCVRRRNAVNINDRDQLTDLWGDIHRIKHNSRRVDHPTQLPPQLMYRLISLFTKPGEIVLDCFNGSGTTTLTAHQLNRRYIGIERSKEYADLSIQRHEEISKGLDPFRKRLEITPKAKNSPVPRLIKQKYAVPKKALQLEVKKIANIIGHIPSKEELLRFSKYPIEYYEKYFVSWGEVCAAARTTGMSEKRNIEIPLFGGYYMDNMFSSGR